MDHTARLAPELLAMVLDHLQDADVVRAAHLNRHWRAAAIEHDNFACSVKIRRTGETGVSGERRDIELLDLALQCNLRIVLGITVIPTYPHLSLVPSDWAEVRAVLGRVSHRVKSLELAIDGVGLLTELFESMHPMPWPALQRLKILACEDDGGQVPAPTQLFKCKFPHVRDLQLTDLYFPPELGGLDENPRDIPWPRLRHVHAAFYARAYSLDFSSRILSGVSQLRLDLAQLSNFTPRLILPTNLHRLLVSFRPNAGDSTHIPLESMHEILDTIYISHASIKHLEIGFEAAQPVDPTKFVTNLPSTPAQHAHIFTKHIERAPVTGDPARLVTVSIAAGDYTRRFEVLDRGVRRMTKIVRRFCQLPATDFVGRVEIEHEFLPYFLGIDIKFPALEHLIIRVPPGDLESFWPVIADIEEIRDTSSHKEERSTGVQLLVPPLSQQKRSVRCSSLKTVHLVQSLKDASVLPRPKIRWDEVLKLVHELGIDMMPQETRPQLLLEGVTIVQEQPFSQVRQLA